MTMNTQTGNTKTIFLAIVAAIIVCVVFFILLLNVDRDTTEQLRDDSETATTTDDNEGEAGMWVTYVNEEYGFTLEYPRGWEVAEYLDDPVAPKINFYEPPVAAEKLPLTHHSEEVTHVSVFPEGIPTEGFFGESTETNVNLSVEVEQARDYVLADGTRFATIAFLGTGGPNWTESGFLFAHAEIDNLSVSCERGGEPIAMEQCDVLTGDTVVREGEIESVVRDTLVHVLESFEFTE